VRVYPCRRANINRQKPARNKVLNKVERRYRQPAGGFASAQRQQRAQRQYAGRCVRDVVELAVGIDPQLGIGQSEDLCENRRLAVIDRRVMTEKLL
jgi:hypothetical protein